MCEPMIQVVLAYATASIFIIIAIAFFLVMVSMAKALWKGDL